MTVAEVATWMALDIGAKTHAFACQHGTQRETGQVRNDPVALRAWLAPHCRAGRTVRLLVEATGVYYLEVALIAHELGAEVMVINPRAAHHFAQALSQRNKTDRLDAAMLLECLQRMPFQAWQPPRRSWRQLRSYGRFLVQLTEEGTADRNRLHALTNTPDSPASLRRELQHKLTANDRRIERVRAEALTLIEADAYLQARFAALVSIQGVAAVSAIALLTELAALPPNLTSRACVCHAGLDPRVFESGTSVHKAPRISRRGNQYLRRALFYPALSAGEHDPRAKAFKDRLLGRGKKKMQANVAIMRKLLTGAWAMMRDPKPYDGSRLYADLKIA